MLTTVRSRRPTTSRVADAAIKELSQFFEVVDQGVPKRYLGMDLALDARGIRLSQETYLTDVLKRYSMDTCKAAPLPIVELLMPRTETEAKADTEVYRSIVGALQYACTCTRPDLAFAVSHLASFSANPSAAHMTALQQTLRYVKGTLMLGLLFARNRSDEMKAKVPDGLVVFADADFAADRVDRRSVSGCVVFHHGAPIAWRSKKQGCVVHSTAEAEMVSSSQACKMVKPLLEMMEEIGCEKTPLRPALLFEDNMTVVHLVRSPLPDYAFTRFKHVDVCHFWIRECVRGAAPLVRVEHVRSQDQVADIMTKPLTKTQFFACVRMLGLSEGPARPKMLLSVVSS